MKLAPLVLVVAMATAGCATAAKDNKLPADVQAVLDKADEIELISLDPTRGQEKPKDDFHGFKVLGKTTIKKDDKKAVLEALGKGIKDNEGMVAACFNPRHGIKATHDGKTVELVICFECMSIQVFGGEKKESSVLTTSSPQKAFDKVLTDAKVPLADKPGK